MNGLGYTPICSSSSAQKTYDAAFHGITAPFFRKATGRNDGSISSNSNGILIIEK